MVSFGTVLKTPEEKLFPRLISGLEFIVIESDCRNRKDLAFALVLFLIQFIHCGLRVRLSLVGSRSGLVDLLRFHLLPDSSGLSCFPWSFKSNRGGDKPLLKPIME